MKLINRYNNWGNIVTDQGHESLLPFIQESLRQHKRKCSNTQVKRLIAEKAVKLNGETVVGTELVNNGDILKIGKKIWFKFKGEVDTLHTLAIANHYE